MNDDQRTRIRTADGFVAALDQSGGSTPKALEAYGVAAGSWSNDDEMFDLIHQMRVRIMTSPAFNGDRVLAAILFEATMDREVEGRGTADYLWGVKGVVPLLKIDKGLADEADGVQLMKPMPDLDPLLARARDKGIFGTKERSVIKAACASGIDAIADQQFAVGRQVLAAGLLPILEPEVDIHIPDKAEAEALLKQALLVRLDGLAGDEEVMFKLTLPDTDGFYADLVGHPKVARVVALSGGYPRDEANARLARNHGVIASFSRALTEGLSAQQSQEQFDAKLDVTIGAIFEASRT